MKARRRRKQKKNIPICAALTLLCLTIVSAHFLSGLYARYISKDMQDDSAKVAFISEPVIVETDDFKNGKLLISPGISIKKDVEVSYTGSEVACYLFLKVTTYDWITANNTDFYGFVDDNDGDTEDNISWKMAEGWTFLKTDAGNLIYYKLLSPNPNASVVTDDVIQDGEIIVGSRLKKSELLTLKNTDIDFQAVVVQFNDELNSLNETEHASNAWDSVKDKQ